METDPKATQPRVNFLLRQVVVPSWMAVVLTLTLIGVLVNQIIANPLRLFAILAFGVMFLALVIIPLRRRAGQATDAEIKAEIKAAPTHEEARRVAWRQYRTYQMWHIVIVSLAAAGVLMDATGIITAF